MFSADSTQVGGSSTEGVPYVWGANTSNALGILFDNRLNNTNIRSAATTQIGVYGISTANYNTGWQAITFCAIKQDGTFWAQGDNDFGQFGNNTRLQYSTSAYTRGLTKVRDGETWALVAGGRANMATKTDGTMWVCGDADNGWLGNGTDGIRRSSPVQLGGTNWPTSDPKKIAVGSYTMYAIKQDGTLWGWGYNAQGQLGQNNLVNKSSPVQIGSDTNWSKVSAGQYAFLAVKTDGTLWCCGGNTYGQLGIGFSADTVAGRSSPVQIGSGTDWATVGNFGFSSFAIKTNGTLWAWGGSGDGQLGLNITGFRSSPVQVGSLTNWADIYPGTAGASECIAFKKTDGTLWVSGNTANQYGTPNANCSSPIQVGSLTDVVGVTGSQTSNYGSYQSFSVVVRSTTGANLGQSGSGTSTLYWENIPYAPVPILFSTVTKWKDISLGGYSGSGVSSTGMLYTWGTNTYGQLGDGTVVTKNSPIQIGSLTTWSQVWSTFNCTAAIKTDGTLWTWGNNNYGQLGTSNAGVSQSSPVQVGALTNWQQLSGWSDNVTYAGFAAVKTNGTLWAWGYNDQGQLGQGNTITRESPVQIGAGTTWSYVSMGFTYVVALKTDGTMWSWGTNAQGQLGQNDIVARSSPVQIGSGNTWVSVACGYASVWAVKSDGTLWAWGEGTSGKLGTGTVINVSSPVQVGSLTNWSKAGARVSAMYAYKTDGTLWGCGVYPGNGTQYRSSPVQITSGATGGTTSWLSLADVNPSPNSGAGALKA